MYLFGKRTWDLLDGKQLSHAHLIFNLCEIMHEIHNVRIESHFSPGPDKSYPESMGAFDKGVVNSNGLELLDIAKRH